MALIFRRTLGGGTPQYESVPASNVAISANACVSSSSGYADDAGQPTTITIIGVAEAAVDNSGGSAGDKNVNVICNLDAVFEGDIDTGTIGQDDMWKVVAISAGGLTVVAGTAVTDTTGCFRNRVLKSTTVTVGNLIFSGEYA